MKAVDFANYSDIPTPEQIRCWMDQGYTKAIIGTSFPRKVFDDGSPNPAYVADAQIAACEAQGMDVEEYQFVGHYRPTARPWWLDVELGETVADIRAAVQANHPVGIYTRKGIWDALGWDIVAEFPWLKLWDAAYADPPQPFVPYGGWTSRAIHQWHDSTDLGGVNVDLDIIEEVEEDEMKPCFAWVPDYAGGSIWFVGPSGCGWATQQTAINEIAQMYQITNVPTITLSRAAIHALGG